MKTVLLLFGGESSEHDVSMASSKNVDAAIDHEKYDVRYGYIDTTGQWWLVSSITDNVDDAVMLLPKLGTGSLMAGDESLTVEVILPILHGENGEDGSVQALAQLLHIPVVGCDMTSSAIAMNKHIAKQVAMNHDMKVAPYAVHYGEQPLPLYTQLVEALGETLFVKPATGGSSVGVSKVHNQAELEQAVQQAHDYDRTVLIEKAVTARELEVAVLGDYIDNQVSAVGEIIPEGDFYTYDSKYDSNSTSQAVIPADIAPEIQEKLQRLAQRLFLILGLRGMARVDFFLDKQDGEIYFNEVNTIPGFTNISMYPKLWEQAGISTTVLLDQLISIALDKK